MSTRWKYAAISIIVILSGCGNYNYEYHTMPAETLAQVERNPASYSRTLLAFEGEILQAEETKDSTIFQIFVGNLYEKNRSSLIVVFPYTGTTIARGHTVSILGYPGGKISGTNAFGGVVSPVTFAAIAVCDHGYTSKSGYWYAQGKDDIYHRWASGELFNPKTNSSPVKAKIVKREQQELNSQVAQETNGDWTIIEKPGAVSTLITGIDGSNIVGGYKTAVNGSTHGFLFNGTTWTTLDMPGATSTNINDIDGNNIVGDYTDASRKTHGFLYNGKTWTTIDRPGVSNIHISSIDGSNIIGDYLDADNYFHGFLYDGKSWTMIEPPGWNSDFGLNLEEISGSNIVGYYVNPSSGAYDGFFYNGSGWKVLVIPVPGSPLTYVTGIDGSNIVGYYNSSTDKSKLIHGFIYDGNKWTTLDKPGAFATWIQGISGNKIVGNYGLRSGMSPMFISHGFIYELPKK